MGSIREEACVDGNWKDEGSEDRGSATEDFEDKGFEAGGTKDDDFEDEGCESTDCETGVISSHIPKGRR